MLNFFEKMHSTIDAINRRLYGVVGFSSTCYSANMKKLFLRTGWLLMTTLALYLFAITWIYFSFRPDVNFLLTKQDIVHFLPWRIAFYLHIAGAMFALAVGPFNFLTGLQSKYKKLHRILGYIYVVGILILGGPAGFFMSFYATGGMGAKIAFMILSILWVTTTWLAIKRIIQKDVKGHWAWMIRSYALTFSAVTLRLWTPILSLGLNFTEVQTLAMVPWLAWIPNLLVAEILIRKRYKIPKTKHQISNG